MILYKIYFIKLRVTWLDKKYHHFWIKVMNKLFPLLYRFSKSYLKKDETRGEDYIVSLTCFPARIDKVWLTLESLLRQSYQPGRLIIWLSATEFPDKSKLPESLLSLERRGVEIRLCPDNLMPHKKYYYTLHDFPEATIITMDDDIIYPPDLLNKLVIAHQKSPKNICCIIARAIKYSNGGLMPYDQWAYLNGKTEASFKLLPVGAGGVLYPPGSLHPEVSNIEQIKKICLCADDLWLKTMSLLNETKVACLSDEYSRFFLPILQKDQQRLMDTNILKGQNELIFNKLINYYHIPPSLFAAD
jgi:hypothetical protein